MKIEEFLNSFTDSEFQGTKLLSYYPHTLSFSNYVPDEFEEFIKNICSLNKFRTDCGQILRGSESKLPDPAPAKLCGWDPDP